MHWYLDVLKKYFVFEGRAQRAEFWMFLLISMIVSFAIGLVDGFVGLYGIPTIVYFVAIICPSLGVAIRRLHDTGRSGWWLLIGFVPVIGIVLIVFYILDSEAGDNDYGSNPKGI